MKKTLTILFVAFVTNLVWEHAHAFLYTPLSMGEPLSELALFRSACMDALMIGILALPFLFVPILKKRAWLIVPLGFVLAVCIEWYALAAGLWAYNGFMPVLPLVNVGLTPAIQLGLLGYVSYKVGESVPRLSLHKLKATS